MSHAPSAVRCAPRPPGQQDGRRGQGAWVGLLCLAGLSSLAGTSALLPGPAILPLPYVLETVPGRAELTPSSLMAGSTGHHLTLTVDIGPEPVEPGGRIDLVFGAQQLDLGAGPRLYFPQNLFWLPFQVHDPKQDQFLQIEENIGKARLVPELPGPLKLLRPVFRLLRIDRGVTAPYSVKELAARSFRAPLRVRGGRLEPHARLTFTLGGLRGEAVGLAASPAEAVLHIAVLIDHAGAGRFRLLEHPARLEVVGGEPVKLQVVAPSVVGPGSALKVCVVAVDRFGGRSRHFTGRARLQLSGRNGSASTQVPLHFTSAAQGRLEVSLTAPEGDIGWLEVIPEAVAETPPGLAGSGQPLLLAAEGARLFWGDIHRHSVLADGYLPPEEVYRRGIEEERLDWLSLSEHSHPDPFNTFGQSRRRLTLSPEEWSYLVALSNRHDDLPEFTSLTGFEWSSDDGHRNVYLHPEEPPLHPISHLTLEGEQTVSELYQALQGRRALVIPHHPGWQLGGRPYVWGDPTSSSALLRVAEVYSQHGNSEFYGNPRPIHAGANVPAPRHPLVRRLVGESVLGPHDQAPPTSPGFVRHALANGHRVGLIAASDNHFMDVGPISYSGGLTALWATENSRRSLWEALHARRAFATSGARMILELEIDGHPPGSEFRSSGTPSLRYRVLGTAPLKGVEILRHDASSVESSHTRLTVDVPTGSRVVEGTRVDRDFRPPGHYYLRVEQEDGELGWAGPLWLDAPEPL